MLLANTHFKPVIGVDFHLLIVPPIVLPIPYIGIVIDPFDYIPYIGGTVKINHVHKGNGLTMGRFITFMHLPKTALPNVGHDSYSLFSSSTVKANHGSLAPTGFLCMSCNDVGLPISFSLKKGTFKPLPSLYLPISTVLPIPFGKPVRVGGPYPPDLMALAMNLLFSLGFAYAFKFLGKGAKFLLNKAMDNSAAIKKFTLSLEEKLGVCLHDPVDVVSGRVFYEYIDFTMPGAIPLTWKRIWHSDSKYQGALGHGQHHTYDTHLIVEKSVEAIWAILPDGRPAYFPLLQNEGDSYYNTGERRSLTIKDGNYILQDHESNLFYLFTRKGDNEKCLLQKLYNLAGNMIQFQYNDAGNLTTITDTANRKIKLSVNKEGLITNVSATHNGNTKQLVAYGYNDAVDLVKITDPLGQSTQLVFENHQMVKKTDRHGQSFHWIYDAKGRCTQTSGKDKLLGGTIEYHKGYNIDTDSLGRRQVIYYNNKNQCTQITDAEGNSSYFEYTDDGLLLRAIDQEDNVTGYTYNDKGKITKIQLPDGSQLQKIYDEDSRLMLERDAGGRTTVYTYYDNGQLRNVIDHNNATTQYSYNNKGLLQTITNAAAKQVQLAYDADNNLIKTSFANGNTQQWVYDNWGRCVTSINPVGATGNQSYDELDRVVNASMPDGSNIKLQYNAYDEVTEAQRNGQTVHFEYTALGLLKQRTQNGEKIKFIYDTEQQLNAVVNEYGERYSFGRNKNGSIISETGFDGLQRTHARTPADRVSRIERPGKRWTEYEYDANGRTIRAEYSDGTWETYGYNANGQLINAANQNSSLQIERDELGRILKETQDGQWVASSYHAVYGRQTVQSSLGANITLTYDEDGQINKLQAGNGAENWQASMQYSSLGLEVDRLMTGNLRNSQLYDNAGRPYEQRIISNGRVELHKQYRWEANDKLQTVTDVLTGNAVKYGYDAFENLVTAASGFADIECYFRDDVGNIFNHENKQDRKYSTGGRLLQKDGKAYYYYDAEGNLTDKAVREEGQWSYSYYGNGMLKTVKRPDGKLVSFEYDALARRTAKIFNKGITRFIWDGNTPLHEWKYKIEERPKMAVDELGVITFDREEPAADVTSWIFDEGSFKPAAKIIGSESYSIINDYLGTPKQAFDKEGKKVWERELSVYGKLKKEEGEKDFIPFLFQGQYFDTETGLAYNRFRYYFIEEGMYLNQDRIKLSGGSKLYEYSKNPTIIFDPFGLLDFFHATKGPDAANSIINNGIDLSKNRLNLDFNPSQQAGFYVTNDLEQAQKWATKHGGEILHYDVPESELAKLNIKTFETPSSEWADFVSKGREGTLNHSFDAVDGPMLKNPYNYLEKGAQPTGHQLALFTDDATKTFDKNLIGKVKCH